MDEKDEGCESKSFQLELDGPTMHQFSESCSLEESITEKRYLQNLQAIIPELENNDNFLHVFGRNNYAHQIKVEWEHDGNKFIEMCLEQNVDGNLPAMEAAIRCQKEALLALLLPFVMFPDSNRLRSLIHHSNRNGHSLLTYVSHYSHPLSVVHGILIELEGVVHSHNAIEMKKCLRHSLGSTSEAKRSCQVVDLVLEDAQDVSFCGRLKSFITLLFMVFIFKSLLTLADFTSDVVLLNDYHRLWTKQEERVDNLSLSRCHEDGHVEVSNITSHIHNIDDSISTRTLDIDLSCYEGAISGQHRFLITLLFIVLPYSLYLFELIRFRIVDSLLKSDVFKSLGSFAFGLLKFSVNCLVFLTWPFVGFLRQFWHTYKLDSSTKEDKIIKIRNDVFRSNLMSSRAQLIEVCTEASLQPLFQFYLIFQDILELDYADYFKTDNISLLFTEEKRRQTVSVVISLLTLALSYTFQYHMNKDFTLSISARIVYFFHLISLILSRLLAFEMFAYALGVGNFRYAILCLFFHVSLMTILHYLFSYVISPTDGDKVSTDDSSETKQRDVYVECEQEFDNVMSPPHEGNLDCDDVSMSVENERGRCHCCGRENFRDLTLVVQNCVFNGLANLYVHNNLLVFFHEDESGVGELNDISSSGRSHNKSTSNIDTCCEFNSVSESDNKHAVGENTFQRTLDRNIENKTGRGICRNNSRHSVRLLNRRYSSINHNDNNNAHANIKLNSTSVSLPSSSRQGQKREYVRNEKPLNKKEKIPSNTVHGEAKDEFTSDVRVFGRQTSSVDSKMIFTFTPTFAIRKTFNRQMAFELVFLVETAVMLYTATYVKEFHSTIVLEKASSLFGMKDLKVTLFHTLTSLVIIFYLFGNLLRFIFYYFFHPWAQLIRSTSRFNCTEGT